MRILTIIFFLGKVLVQPIFAQTLSDDRFICQTQLSESNYELVSVPYTSISISSNYRVGQIHAVVSDRPIIPNFERRRVTVWDSQSCNQVWEWRQKQIEDLPISISFSTSNTDLLAFGTHRSIFIWNTISNTRISEFKNHGADILFFHKNLITASVLQNKILVHVYNPDSWQKKNSFDIIPDEDVVFQDLDLTPDGQLLAAAWRGQLGEDGNFQDKGEVSIWNANTSEKLCSNNVGGAFSVDFSLDGDYIVMGGTDGVIRVLNARTCVQNFSKDLVAKNDWIQDVKFVEDNNIVVYFWSTKVNSLNSQIFLYDWKNNYVLGRSLMHHNGVWLKPEYSLGVSPNGQYFATGISESINSSLMIWSARSIVRINLEDKIKLNNIYVFPNPVSDYVTFEGLTNDAIITIYDLLGRKVKYTTNSYVDVSELPRGLYMYRVESEFHKSIVSGRFMKQ